MKLAVCGLLSLGCVFAVSQDDEKQTTRLQDEVKRLKEKNELLEKMMERLKGGWIESLARDEAFARAVAAEVQRSPVASRRIEKEIRKYCASRNAAETLLENDDLTSGLEKKLPESRSFTALLAKQDAFHRALHENRNYRERLEVLLERHPEIVLESIFKDDRSVRTVAERIMRCPQALEEGLPKSDRFLRNIGDRLAQDRNFGDRLPDNDTFIRELKRELK